MSSENKLYFSHDFYSRDNLSNLRMKCGLEGYGIYWCLVEIMHENGGEIKESDIDGIAYNLHTDASKNSQSNRKIAIRLVQKKKV